MLEALLAHIINPLIFAPSFFHSILDLRLTSLCKGRIVRLFRWGAKKAASTFWGLAAFLRLYITLFSPTHSTYLKINKYIRDKTILDHHEQESHHFRRDHA